MTDLGICAVVVTYHPSADMLENIPRVLAQTQGLVVVDNGSDADELNRIRIACQTLGFHLIENRENLGIAEALNQAIGWARANRYLWVILFDQDSKITENFVAHMLEAWESHPDRAHVCSIHPMYVHPETGLEQRVRRAADGGPIVSITSGALMPTWIFDKIGWFASDFFIDCVDIEYSFRIRAAGYLIADSRKAVLLHAAGHPRKFSFLGFNFRPGHHSAERYYYIARNRIAVYRKYLHVFPLWILRSIYEYFRDTVKWVIVEDNRARKIRNFLIGTWDGLLGRMGKREGL